MMPAGLWYRPAYYGAEQHEQLRDSARRCEPSATASGMIDVSTLGGLDVRGPDAAEILDRIYTFTYVKQPVGRTRYVLTDDHDRGHHRRRRRLPLRRRLVSTSPRPPGAWTPSIGPCCAGTRSGGSTVDIANVTAAYAGIKWRARWRATVS